MNRRPQPTRSDSDQLAESRRQGQRSLLASTLMLASGLLGTACEEPEPTPAMPPPVVAPAATAAPMPQTDSKPTQDLGHRDDAKRPLLEGPRLRADDTLWDWGVAIAGQELRHLFVLHNDGDAPVRIVKVRPT